MWDIVTKAWSQDAPHRPSIIEIHDIIAKLNDETGDADEGEWDIDGADGEGEWLSDTSESWDEQNPAIVVCYESYDELCKSCNMLESFTYLFYSLYP